MVASLLRFDLMLLTVFVTRGITATLLFVNRKQPRQMLLAGVLAGLIASMGYLALTVLFEADVSVIDDLSRGLSSNLVACFGGGLLSGLLGMMMRAPAQLVMGHVSRDRLHELTDIESPLLQKMARDAPGSWEHSRAMANLAEAAAAAIGADSLLTRVGAYYHDLGKSVQPKYFIENLGGDRSPHDDLAPEVSADAIMAHVVLGTKMLREGGIPEPVVEFAYTHHGTQAVEYFWAKYQQAERPEGEKSLDRSHFRYPGMRPMTKETAILMLVDSIEAASRTVQPPEHDKFEEMIQRVVFTKLKSGQLDESGLTVSDLRIMTRRMAATLVNMYHGRIKYPWQHEKEREEAAKRERDEAEQAGEVPIPVSILIPGRSPIPSRRPTVRPQRRAIRWPPPRPMTRLTSTYAERRGSEPLAARSR
jgi:putative nucleotidyltransferase with HDIG domain